MDFLLVDESTDEITGWSITCAMADGRRCVCVDDETITGDALPDHKGDMCGGTLTEGFVYTAPASSVEDPKITALKNLDPDALPGDALKIVVEFLQRT